MISVLVYCPQCLRMTEHDGYGCTPCRDKALDCIREWYRSNGLDLEGVEDVCLVARVFQAAGSVTPQAGCYLTSGGTLARELSRAKRFKDTREATNFILEHTPDIALNYVVVYGAVAA
jgi:hypothetical protein